MKIVVIFLFLFIMIFNNESEPSNIQTGNNSISISGKNLNFEEENGLEYIDQKITSGFRKLKKLILQIVRISYHTMKIIEREFKLFFPFNYIVVFICVIFVFLKVKQVLFTLITSDSHVKNLLDT